MDVEHIVIAKMFEKNLIFLLKGRKEKQPTKKKQLCLVGKFLKKFLSKILFKKKGCVA